jgi:hypothetical protein
MPRRRVTPSKGGTKHVENLKRTIERQARKVVMGPPPTRPPIVRPSKKKAIGIYGIELPRIRILPLPPPRYPPPAHLSMAGIMGPVKTEDTVV